jgi:hypothetical protein
VGVMQMHEANRQNSVWTDERTETLRRLWAKGWPASKIARHFDCGMTRNSVIGKVHRLKLTRRNPDNWRGPSSTGGSAGKPVKQKVRAQAGSVSIVGRLSKPLAKHKAGRHTGKSQLAERRVEILSITPVDPAAFFDVKPSQCRYPVGDWNGPVERKFYCGAPKKPGSSFCPDHHLVCWVPHRRRVKEAA